MQRAFLSPGGFKRVLGYALALSMNLGLFWLVLGDLKLSFVLGAIAAAAGVALLSAVEPRNRQRVEQRSREGTRVPLPKVMPIRS